MTTYAEYRDNAIHWYQLGGPKYVRRPVINNTGNSRQVRRRREREFENAPLSYNLMDKLQRMHLGQGLFMQAHWGGSVRSYWPGWANETRKPRRDYSKRYAALFAVPANEADV